MKISVKDNGRDIATCNCGWRGEIQDANWIQEDEFGKCPECGSENFIAYKYDEWNDIYKWEWDSWKARLAVYAMLAGTLIFGMIPWIWGLIEEFKFFWNLIF
jgi:hypothetical protein